MIMSWLDRENGLKDVIDYWVQRSSNFDNVLIIDRSDPKCFLDLPTSMF